MWYYPNCELNTKKWFVEHAAKDWVYLDCGANIGYYSILFSQLSPNGKVYAFEPTSTSEMLEKNLFENNCSNVKIVKEAVGMHDGPKDDAIFRIWGQDAEKTEYPFTTIDSFVEKNNINRIDCIKIDVDSFDFEVLQGALKTMQKHNPYVVVELNHALNKRGQSNSEAFEWLAVQGYVEALVIDHENFILRKDADVCAGAKNSLKLSYL